MIKPPPGVIPATELVEKVGFNALIYGLPKVGKTWLGLSLLDDPACCPVFVIDVDHSPKTFEGLENVIYGAVPPGAEGWNRVANVYLPWLVSGDTGVQSVFVDGLSKLNTFGLDYALRKNLTSNKRDEECRTALPGMADYGANNRQFLRAINDFRALAYAKGMNVVFTCHESEDNGAKTVSLTRQLKKEVPGIPDVLAYCYQKDGERGILLQGNEKFPAQARHPRGTENPLPAKVVDPNLADIVKKWRDA